MNRFSLPAVEALIRAALAEDVGRGDVTTTSTVSAEVKARAEIVAKQDGVLAGVGVVGKVYELLGAAGVSVDERLADGKRFSIGDVVVRASGPARDLLTGERVALNFLQRLCGVATQTRRYVDRVEKARARICDTRKTTPGFRALEKYAVRMGGGSNHRGGLDDGVLIKDNHIVAAGGVAKAVTRARAAAPHTIKIEVECTNMREVDAALQSGADIILLDNMSTAEMAKAVERIAGRALVEASGGITLETVSAVAKTGVDLISVGALTHSAPAIDLSMRIKLLRS
jgi:nicotinate-nucleotide pyrophosphorylase (carboxylating)